MELAHLIRDRADVLALWLGVTKRPPGNQSGNNQHTKKAEEEEGNLYNVQSSAPEAPTGNTAAAGLRKLQKAALEGNEKAGEELQAVVTGAKSVHRACVESRLRKTTRIDADVRQRCDLRPHG